MALAAPVHPARLVAPVVLVGQLALKLLVIRLLRHMQRDLRPWLPVL